jgi:hypothetical protein
MEGVAAFAYRAAAANANPGQPPSRFLPRNFCFNM